MSDEKPEGEPTLVEKWVKDQQEWQKMAMEYFDSMVKNDEFLVHLGNAMRGSLLAGKAYPGTEPPEEEDDTATAADDRMDLVLHALHLLQGDVADLKVAVDDLAAKLSDLEQKPAEAPPAVPPQPITATAPTAPGDAVTAADPEPSVPPPSEGLTPKPAPAEWNRGEG